MSKGGVNMLNKYETVFIIDPKIEDKKPIIDKFVDLINANGKVENVDEWGMRKLAYEIEDNTEGYYVLVNFEADAKFVAELERIFRITIEVIKFIVVRKED